MINIVNINMIYMIYRINMIMIISNNNLLTKHHKLFNFYQILFINILLLLLLY